MKRHRETEPMHAPTEASPETQPVAANLPLRRSVLAGWGNYPQVECATARPERIKTLARAITGALGDDARRIARGLGRSYGDSAVSDAGVVIDTTRLDRYRAFDPATGRLTCEAGTSLAQILADFAPRGFLPMVSPGTKYVTVGGCIANDVHGKGHHVDGCFSQCTESFRIMLASGEVVNASPTSNADLYWANFGGMGLLGVIVDATIRLRPVETTFFKQQALSVPNLDAMLDALETNAHLPYSVAWVDSLATGGSLGRGVVIVGEHASLDDLSSRQRQAPLRTSPPPIVTLPMSMPSQALNTATVRLLNLVLDQVQKRAAPIAHYEKFFYPLDFVGEWNKGYGKRGFTQYQFVVPLSNGREHIRELLETIAHSGQSPFLNVLKRFGPERPETQLSFPFEGYTFAIDFPIRDGLETLLAQLDARLLEMGGRVYLGKDAFVDQATFEAMYPQLDAWRAVKAKYDPDSIFSSNQSRRLGLSR